MNKQGEKTITISWTTTVEEHYTAEIDAAEWTGIVENDDLDNDLAQYEDDWTLKSCAVLSREAG